MFKSSMWDGAVKHAHLFLAGGAGRVRGGGACAQSLLYVQIELVEFPHQLAHRLRPRRLDLRRFLWVIREALREDKLTVLFHHSYDR